MQNNGLAVAHSEPFVSFRARQSFQFSSAINAATRCRNLAAPQYDTSV